MIRKQFCREELPEIVTLLRQQFGYTNTFAFYGDLGSGKTTLIRELLLHVGVKEPITSPTFAYMNQYQSVKNKNRYLHFDLYRLSKLDELYSLGLDEFLLDTSAYIFIEWPEIAMPLIMPHACIITLAYAERGKSRLITIKSPTAAF